MKSLLDKTFRYTPAAATDIRKTFARLRREQKAAEERERMNAAEAAAKAVPIKRAASK